MKNGGFETVSYGKKGGGLHEIETLTGAKRLILNKKQFSKNSGGRGYIDPSQREIQYQEGDE